MEPVALRVLVVEDNQADYELILHALRRGGFAVTVRRLEDPAGVAEALLAFPADIVVSDHAFPRGNGLDVVRAVQAEQPPLPVLVVTGAIDEETAADYIKAGAADYVVKQRLHRLAPAVQRALTLKAALHEAMNAELAREESERRFRSLIEHSSDVITLLDATGAIVYSTQSLKPTLGYAAGEMTGRSVLDLIHPDQLSSAAQLLEQLLQGSGQAVRGEFRVRHKDGSWRDLEAVLVNRLADP